MGFLHAGCMRMVELLSGKQPVPLHPMKGTPDFSVPLGRGAVQAFSGQPDVQSTGKGEVGRDITYKVPALKHICQEHEEKKVQSRYLYLLCPLLLCNVSLRRWIPLTGKQYDWCCPSEKCFHCKSYLCPQLCHHNSALAQAAPAACTWWGSSQPTLSLWRPLATGWPLWGGSRPGRASWAWRVWLSSSNSAELKPRYISRLKNWPGNPESKKETSELSQTRNKARPSWAKPQKTSSFCLAPFDPANLDGTIHIQKSTMKY